ncbi:hypothetical protein R1sor_004973 [Riccia sorocarpa]|uniref:BSD2 cysteine rich domain-containing protein n=1 Tax=Riccia sorocarpa TaxID=122646 RepID=A0ABD3HIH2_9MARC
MATLVTCTSCVAVHSTVTFSPRSCCRASTSSSSSSASPAGSSGSTLSRPPLVSTSRSSTVGNSFASPSPSFSTRPALRHSGCEAAPEPAPGAPTAQTKSIVCTNCDGNGAVVCTQCKGEGVNTEDHFNGRFKVGTICWLCRGKRQMLCGDCNGAGFLGGFMNAFED